MITAHAERSGLAVGLAISAVIHVLAFAVLNLFIDFGPPASPNAVSAEPEAVRVFAIVPEQEETPSMHRQVHRRAANQVEQPAAEPPIPNPMTGRPTLPADSVAEPGSGLRAGTASVLDRMAPQVYDPRLRARTDTLSIPEKTEIERTLEPVYRTMAAFNDSLIPAQESELRALDWTVRTGNGERWGYTRDSIHLGKHTLPFRLEHAGYGVAAQRQRECNETKYQLDLALARNRLNERVNAIRDRKHSERTKKIATRPDSAGTGESDG